MTNKPKEFYVLPPFLDMSTVHTCFAHKPNNFHTENGKYTHVIEAGPVLEKIKRLEAALQKCKETVDACLDPCGIDNKEAEAIGNKAILTMLKIELESILEGK